MSRQPFLDPNRSYTFNNYFELEFAVDDLVAEFGYSFDRVIEELEIVVRILLTALIN